MLNFFSQLMKFYCEEDIPLEDRQAASVYSQLDHCRTNQGWLVWLTHQSESVFDRKDGF